MRGHGRGDQRLQFAQIVGGGEHALLLDRHRGLPQQILDMGDVGWRMRGRGCPNRRRGCAV